MLILLIVLILLFGGGGLYGYRGGYYGGGGISVVGLIVLLLVLFAIFGGNVYAADATAPATTVAALPVYQAIEPYLLTAFGVIFSALLGWGLTQLQTRTGIRVSEDARNRVQTAAFNAAGRILAAQEGNIATVKFDVRSPWVAAEVPKLEASVGDAIQQLGMTPQRTAELIAGKIGVLQSQAAAVPPTVVVSK